MKKFLLALTVLVAFGLVAFAFVMKNDETTPALPAPVEGEITWMDWNTAVNAAKKKPKKIFVDCYTDWCGWCKRMDATTFKDPAVVEYMNKYFYAVKFDAEQKTDIAWRDRTFKFINSGRRGVHELAYSLLDGRLGYPSFVYLDEKFDRVTVSPGYKQPDQILKELKWVAEGHFKTKSFEEYQKAAQ